MKVNLRVGPFKGLLAIFRTEWAYGISSKIKTATIDAHYLLFDIDSRRIEPFLEWFKKKGLHDYPHIVYSTPHGYHAICLKPVSMENFVKTVIEAPGLDFTWLSIGLKRGYWFLRSHSFVPFAGLQHMRIQLPKETEGP